jgi:hypothetical protein
MQEIKERLYVIDDVLSGRAALQGPLANEFCFLQLRFICECISYACVIAHAYIKELQSPNLQKAYSADLLMKALDKLHKEFYPKPRKMTDNEKGVHLDEIKETYLSKEDLKKLNGICGDNLHRGTPEKYAFNPTPERLASNRQTIIDFSNKVFRLMESHLMSNRDEPRYILCRFRERGVPVEVFHAGTKE